MIRHRGDARFRLRVLFPPSITAPRCPTRCWPSCTAPTAAGDSIHLHSCTHARPQDVPALSRSDTVHGHGLTRSLVKTVGLYRWTGLTFKSKYVCMQSFME